MGIKEVEMYINFKKKNKKSDVKNGAIDNKSKIEKTPFTGEFDINKIVDILKKEGGRATQKDIRKEAPLSEAKISLMIAELEHKGIIKKIKKGRGNIIVLENK